jgi:hypothetical protein
MIFCWFAHIVKLLSLFGNKAVSICIINVYYLIIEGNNVTQSYSSWRFKLLMLTLYVVGILHGKFKIPNQPKLASIVTSPENKVKGKGI